MSEVGLVVLSFFIAIPIGIILTAMGFWAFQVFASWGLSPAQSVSMIGCCLGVLLWVGTWGGFDL